MKYPASSPAALRKISFSHVRAGRNISRNVLSCNPPDFSPTSIHSLVPSRCTNCQCPIKRMHWMQCFQEGYSIVPRTGLIFLPGSCDHRSIQQPYLEQFVNFFMSWQSHFNWIAFCATPLPHEPQEAYFQLTKLLIWIIIIFHFYGLHLWLS